MAALEVDENEGELEECDTLISDHWDDFEPDSIRKSFQLLDALPEPDAECRMGVDPRLWACDSLTYLNLSSKGLGHLGSEGTAGSSLSSLVSLRDLDLSHNPSLGPELLPAGCLHGLASLRSLNLSSAGLRHWPAALVSLCALETLTANDNALEYLPATLSLLPELRSLSACLNSITELPDQLFIGSPRLQTLNLSDNQVAELPQSAGQLSTLTDLDLARNALTGLPGELATNGKLRTIRASGNPISDKKLFRAVESGDQAKPILQLLRNGTSKSKAKQAAKSQPRPIPARCFAVPSESPDPQVEEPRGGKKKGKKKGSGSSNSASGPSFDSLELKRVVVERDVLAVRPYLCAMLIHVVDESGNERWPFAPHLDTDGVEESRVEACLALLEAGKDLPADGAASIAQEAQRGLRSFLDEQTELHHASEYGNRRRSAAMGSHNASALTFPLRYAARPHRDVVFLPLKYGWMESKGEMSAAEFCRDCVSNDPALRRHAQALQRHVLCPFLVDSTDTVLSVPPLSNGHQTRSTPDCAGPIFVECSSATSEEACRRCLLALVRGFVDRVEKPPCGLRVLVEPVELVCAWNQKQVIGHFPTYCDFKALEEELDDAGDGPSDSE